MGYIFEKSVNIYEKKLISLVAFLGNYGSEYSKTRHNVAWLFEESLGFSSSLNWQKKFKGQYAVLERSAVASQLEKLTGKTINGEKANTGKIYFLKPETYMNLSGESIIELAQFFKIKPEEILVVHDELELAPGFVSLKWSGGLGGHNGLRSAKACLGTADFWRLRFGIGRPNHSDIAGYVLSAFTADEQIILAQVFAQTEELFCKVLCAEPDKYLEEWSKKKVNA